MSDGLLEIREPSGAFGDGWTIVSASPEVFLSRRGDRIWTKPIKGTQPRGAAWVGGGIVWDSDPAAEVEESWVKARPLLDAIGSRVPEAALA